MYMLKEYAAALFKDNSKALKEIEKIKGDRVFFEFMSEAAYKSDKQNRTFHALLQCFWASGCSSFLTFDKLREHYKRYAGLIKLKTGTPLEDFTKKALFKAIKLLPISQEQRDRVIERLQDKFEKELSWSEVTKENATRTIEQLKNDMDIAGVIDSRMGKKYQEIIEGMKGE